MKPLVKENISELVQRGIVKRIPANTPWNMPLLVAPKKDAEGRKTGIRVCLDTRSLNEIIPIDSFKVPLIRDIFSKVACFQMASFLEATSRGMFQGVLAGIRLTIPRWTSSEIFSLTNGFIDTGISYWRRNTGTWSAVRIGTSADECEQNHLVFPLA